MLRVMVLIGVLSLSAGCYQYHESKGSSAQDAAPAAMIPNAAAERTDLPTWVSIVGQLEGPSGGYYGSYHTYYQNSTQLCATLTPISADGGSVPSKPQKNCIYVDVGWDDKFSANFPIQSGDYDQLFGYEFTLVYDSNYYWGTTVGSLVSADCCQLSSDGNSRVATVKLNFLMSQ